MGVESSVRMSFSEDEISAVMNRLNASFDNDCCALEKSIKSHKAKIGKPCMNSTLRTKAKFEESLSKKAQKIRNLKMRSVQPRPITSSSNKNSIFKKYETK